MGIKTTISKPKSKNCFTLKNLPTTWGLRHKGFPIYSAKSIALKNLPTTWGLRLIRRIRIIKFLLPLKNLPTTWGLRLKVRSFNIDYYHSEKPPHHMGIKTIIPFFCLGLFALKNLPTTWGLRLSALLTLVGFSL